ncbi:MAG: tetratricopeptide repeat protein [Pseudomonadota bacterium]|nr:tetratricopeptide repeat protein [Pseudomonadota bacterium]
MQPIFSTALLCLCLFGQQGFAQSPAQAASADDAQAALDAAARTAALERRVTLERTIVELETQHGIYGEELSEAYVELGRTQRALGEHDASADAFNKALQAVRVSNGLNDLRQLPVLQELRTTHEELGDWDDVHAMHYLAFNIAMRNDDEELRVRSLRDLGRWLRKAANEKLVSDYAANAGNLITLYEREIRRLEEKEPYAGRNLHLASLYLDLASTELSEAKRKYELPITEFQTPGLGEQRSTVEQTCFTTIDRNGRPITVCNQPMVVPNMNYYLAPNAQKAQEIRSHLLDVESTVLKAFNVLQDDSDPSARQTELLDEMHRLTGEYNAFVRENRDQQTTLR